MTGRGPPGQPPSHQKGAASLGHLRERFYWNVGLGLLTLIVVACLAVASRTTDSSSADAGAHPIAIRDSTGFGVFYIAARSAQGVGSFHIATRPTTGVGSFHIATRGGT